MMTNMSNMNQRRRESEASNDSDLLYGDNNETPYGDDDPDDQQTIVTAKSQTNPAKPNPS